QGRKAHLREEAIYPGETADLLEGVIADTDGALLGGPLPVEHVLDPVVKATRHAGPESTEDLGRGCFDVGEPPPMLTLQLQGVNARDVAVLREDAHDLSSPLWRVAPPPGVDVPAGTSLRVAFARPSRRVSVLPARRRRPHAARAIFLLPRRRLALQWRAGRAGPAGRGGGAGAGAAAPAARGPPGRHRRAARRQRAT